jgi:AcrR family transcriptional regulator
MRKIDPARHEERRRQIMEAAGRCLARDGFRGATMARICAEAGMSPGNVYHYFESKEAIVAARAQAVLAGWAEAFAELIAGGDPMALLPSKVLALSARSEAGLNTSLNQVNYETLAEAARNPAMAQIVKQHSDAVRGLFRTFLQTAQAQGRVDPALDADAAASTLLGMSQSAREWTARDPEFDLASYLALLDDLARRMLTPPG